MPQRIAAESTAQRLRPRCRSIGPDGYRCRRRLHTAQVGHVAYGPFGGTEWDDENAHPGSWEYVVWGENDECGWSVDRLQAAAEMHEPVPVDPNSVVEPESITGAYWRQVDIHTPVIFVPHPAGHLPLLVDGRHRVYKAWRLGRTVPGVFLTAEEAAAARFTDAEWRRYRALASC